MIEEEILVIKKKEPYPTGDIIKDLPSYPDNYQDHRLYIYKLSKTTISTHPNKNKEGKQQWSVVQWRNVKPPRVDNLWSFETKEEAELFMKKNDFVIYEKQN